MRAELRRWQKELGLTFVHVTHSQEEAMALADVMVVMNHGRIEQVGTPLQVYNAPATEFVARFMGGHNVIRPPRRQAGGAQRPHADRARDSGGTTALAAPSPTSNTRAPTCCSGWSTTPPGASLVRACCPKRSTSQRPLAAGDAWHLSWSPAQAHRCLPDGRHAFQFPTQGAETMSDPSKPIRPASAARCSRARPASWPPAWRPAIHAQEKITLRYLGTAVNQDKAIAEKFKADTGITIQYVAVTTDDVTKRAVTAPNSFDLIDTEYFSLKKIVPDRQPEGHRHQEDQERRQDHLAVHQGRSGNGKKVGDQGTAPKKVMYLESEKSKKFSAVAHPVHDADPTVYNADTLGIRPDLIKRPITSWAELLNPEFKGKAAILNIPSIGIMDAAMVVEAMGKYKYPDKGNMTKKEIDLTIATLIEAKKAGQFRALWKDFNESVNLMASGEVVIQSMWSPAVTAVRTKGIACTFQPLKEGYRAWASGFGVPATLSGKKLDGATSSSTGSSTAGPAPTSTARATTAPCWTPPRPRWKPTSGPTGWKASRPARTSRARTATCWPRPARCATAAATSSAWAASPAGTPSWTRTSTWCASGTSSSRPEP
jgi:hypothetical protein